MLIKIIDLIRYYTPEILKVKVGYIPFAFVGLIYKILKIEILKTRKFKIHLDNDALNFTTRGMLITGYYESGEQKLLKDYLQKDLPVIEFGAGIGLSTMQIRNHVDKKIYSVEADKLSFGLIKKNLEINNINKDVYLYNNAIDYQKKFILFKSYDMFLSNHVEDNNIDIPRLWKLRGEYEIETLKLSDIIKKNSIKEYQLVCDIEGKEIELIKSGDIDNKMCKIIIIDLHDMKYEGKSYTYEDLSRLIQDLGYKVKNQSVDQVVYESTY